MAANNELLGDEAEGAQGEGVLDLIAKQSAVDKDALGVGTGLGVETVAMLPVGEGATELGVAEVVVPGELGNLCFPRDADGSIREWPEAKSHLGACTGGDGLEAKCWIGGDRARRRCGEGGLLNAGLLPGGHETGEIFWIGEEGEDYLYGIGKPLLGLKGMRHLREL